MFGLNEQPQGPKWDLGNVEQAFMLSESPFKAPAISYTLNSFVSSLTLSLKIGGGGGGG